MDINARLPKSEPETADRRQVGDSSQRLLTALDALLVAVRRNAASAPVGDVVEALEATLGKFRASLSHSAQTYCRIDVERLQTALSAFELQIVRPYPIRGSRVQNGEDAEIQVEIQAALANLQAHINLVNANEGADPDRIARGFKRYADQTNRLAALEEEVRSRRTSKTRMPSSDGTSRL